MSSEWEYAPLGELCSRITYGFTNPMPTIDGEGAYMVTAKDIKNGRIQYQTARKTSWDAYRDKLTDKSRPSKGDLLLTKDGSIGRLALCDRDDICINQSVALLQSNGKGDFRYIKYLLEAPEYQRKMESDSDGSTIKHIYITRVDKMMIPLPPRKEQEGIVSILGTLDDKIELNRKTNETLEAMAKALFKSWFVDFDPVKAKVEGRPTGLPTEISDLFPDSFEDSELGEIPSGWEVKSAGTQYDVSIGKTPPRKESQWFSTSHADMPWLSIRDLGEVGVYADKTSERLTREAVDRFNVKIVPANTVVLSFKLTIGRVAITGGEMLTNEAIAHFSPLVKGAGSEYTYCLLSQYDYHSLGSTSSIATAVNSQILREMPLVVPPEISARAFCDATASIFSSIKCGQQETRCLSDLRDALLPKLISGEIRIPDAEKMLEEVGI